VSLTASNAIAFRVWPTYAVKVSFKPTVKHLSVVRDCTASANYRGDVKAGPEGHVAAYAQPFGCDAAGLKKLGEAMI